MLSVRPHFSNLAKQQKQYWDVTVRVAEWIIDDTCLVTCLNLQKNHGGPTDEERHVGDLGNVISADNKIKVDITDKVASLYGEKSVSNVE